MVSVPVTSNRSIRNVDALPRERFRGATPRDMVGPAITQFGGAINEAAVQFDAVEAIYDEADATRIANEWREFERERLRTGENAYLATKGFGAGDGRETVEADLVARSEELLGGARSERARSMAKRALDERMNTASTTIAAHALEQVGIAREEQAQARIEGAVTDAIDARGTEQFAVNLALAQQELGDTAVRNGWSEEQLANENELLVSSIYAGTALAMDAEDGAPTRALDFIRDNADKLTPTDEARLTSQLAPRVDQAWASDIVNSGALDVYLLPGKAPAAPAAPVSNSNTGTPDLDAITAQTESGNRNYDENGNPVTSPVGARFAMQVMPATARDPGFGLRPADPNDADDMNRLGREYRAVMQERYAGDLEKMWAAYNAGPGRVDAAVRKHGDNWLANMPAETRDYVEKNMRAAGAAPGARADVGAPGVAADPRLDSRQMRQAVDRYIADNPGISERRKQALYAEADRSVASARADRAQAEQDADRRLQDWLTENMADPDSLTSINQIPPALLANASPSARNAITERIQITTSRLRDEREEELETAALFELYMMSDEELAETNLDRYIGRIDRRQLGPWYQRKQAAIASVNGAGSDPLSNDRVAGRIDTLGKDFGASRALDADAEDRALWIATRGYVEQRLAGRANKDVTDEELRSIIIAGLQEVSVKGSGWSFGIGLDAFQRTTPRAQLAPGETPDISTLPTDVVEDIRFNLRQNGVRNPSDTLIWTTYQEGLAAGIF